MNKKLRWTGIAVLLFVLLPAASHGSDDMVTVTLRNKAEVDSDKVLLGDIADITGGTEEVIDMLSGIIVCPSLAVDSEKKLLSSDIENKLIRNRINLRFVKINGASQIIASRKARKVTSEELKQAVIDYVYERMPWEEEEVIAEFTRPLIDISIPDGDVTIVVNSLSGSNYLGYNQFSLQVYLDGEQKERFLVGMNIRVFKEVVVSSRQLRRRDTIGSDDVELQKRELKTADKTPLSSLDDAVDKRLITSVPANRILYRSSLEEAPLVAKDQYVANRGRSRAVRLTTRVIAMDVGKSGQFIKVKNLASGKIVIAKVSSPEIVDVITTAAY